MGLGLKSADSYRFLYRSRLSFKASFKAWVALVWVALVWVAPEPVV